MQNNDALLRQVRRHISELSVNIGARPTGSVANHKAENYIKQTFIRNNFQVDLQTFNCIDWEQGETSLNIEGAKIPVTPSPYSLPCDVQADIKVLENLSQLEQAEVSGKVALLRGELTQESLMPKNFRFYNPEHHQRIISLLEAKSPVAILTVSLEDRHLIPVFEDGDFDIPSAVISQNSGDMIAQANLPIHLKISSQRRQAKGANVIAKKNQTSQNKFVVSAHFDTKSGTPGALDNAVGVTVLLILSEMFKDTSLKDCGIELVAFNGEDYFSTPGQVAYLDTYSHEFGNIKLAINCDGLGLENSKVGVSLMECPENYVSQIKSICRASSHIETMPPWYQGDHMLFVAAQVPTLAVTSTGIFELVDNVIHTKHDQPSLINPNAVLETCFFLQEIMSLEATQAAMRC
ncbi:MAG: M28 family peptidase [Cyanobacteria bacterium J06636_16]